MIRLTKQGKEVAGMAACIAVMLTVVSVWSNHAPKPEIPTAVQTNAETSETTTRFIVKASRYSQITEATQATTSGVGKKASDFATQVVKDEELENTTQEVVVPVEITEPETEPITIDNSVMDIQWNGPVLNAYNGTVQGPSGKETYYNLDMSGVISIMRGIGNTDEYWVRDDGMKMLGSYIMVAADLSIRPRGSLVPTSRGMGIVCDTGSFIYQNPYQLDLAVSW